MPSLILRATFILLSIAAGTLLAPSSTSPIVGALAGLGVALACFGAESRLRTIPPAGVTTVALGLGAGLAAGLVVCLAVVPWIPAQSAALVAVLLVLAGAWLGGSVALRQVAPPDGDLADQRPLSARPKVMDTSVIIDGRIADVIATGFVEGVIVLPQFVLRELQHVADSSDPLKRNRGRKGLDILKAIQEAGRVRVEVTDRDFPEVKEVDGKLICLADELGAAIVTNDYNLNKVAQLRGIPILNVNDLANSVKPVVLPGEGLTIQVIKEGKERNQGVGYLDDGTMVVIDNGKRLIGQTIDAVVSSVIQTNAGKMIFCALPDEDPSVTRPRPVRRTDLPGPAATASTVGEA